MSAPKSYALLHRMSTLWAIHMHEHVITIEAGNELHEAASNHSESQCFACPLEISSICRNETMKAFVHGTS